MKQTGAVHIVGLAPTIRPGRLTTIAASLALILSASASSTSSNSFAPQINSSPAPAPGATVYGNDISWPQCPKDGGGNGLPGPMTSASFAVLGLTDGGSFRANPCLARQVASVKTRHLWAGAYAISTYPTSAELARYGGTGTVAERLRRAGAAQAAFNLATMARVGLQSPMVWIDVEPRTKSPWSANTARNNAVIDGVIAGYKAAGVRAGLYSYTKAWKAITGARVLPDVPTWVPVGRSGEDAAEAICAEASYAGGKPWLAQWTDGVRDYDLTCPGVSGQAARGNPLTPYLNVGLASGSRGDAVAALQRSLGATHDTGQGGRLPTRPPPAGQRHRGHRGVAGAGRRDRHIHTCGARFHGHAVRLDLSNYPWRNWDSLLRAGSGCDFSPVKDARRGPSGRSTVHRSTRLRPAYGVLPRVVPSVLPRVVPIPRASGVWEQPL